MLVDIQKLIYEKKSYLQQKKQNEFLNTVVTRVAVCMYICSWRVYGGGMFVYVGCEGWQGAARVVALSVWMLSAISPTSSVQ